MRPGSQLIATLRKSEITLKHLKKKGRLQLFYHSPTSELPVRDIEGKDKTEPHLEKRAENYCRRCYQPNIVGFLKRKEKYLFLFTTCRNSKMPEHYGKRFIVGYIVKKKPILRTKNKKESWWAVQGPTKIFSFEDAYPLKRLTSKRIRGVRRLDEKETAGVLRHFKGKKNILRKCLRGLREPERPQKGARGCG